jgi:hypothetical protein
MSSPRLNHRKRSLALVGEAVESDGLLDSNWQGWLAAEKLRRPRFGMAKALERVSDERHLPPSVLHVPQRRDNVTRPREQRRRRRVLRLAAVLLTTLTN